MTAQKEPPRPTVLPAKTPRPPAPTTNLREGLDPVAPGVPEVVLQRAHRDPRSLSPREVLLLQRTIGNRAVGRLLAPARASASIGMPDQLKAGVESLSGRDLSEVRVHYNSPRPAEVQALAYTQGNDIHLAAGQERHLPHEAWHVVQQQQGRVKPTLQLKGVPVNADPALEQEADVMGARALTGGTPSGPTITAPPPTGAPIQRKAGIPVQTDVVVNDGGPVWYGMILAVHDEAGTYEIRVGGSERTVTVPQGQVDYHPVVEAVASERVAMERFVATLPALDLAGDVKAFGASGDPAPEIVAAQARMKEDADVAAHTIAMFAYMDRHAEAIGNVIKKDFQTISANQAKQRNAYLMSLSSCLDKKIGRGLWIGDDDRGMVAVDALDATTYFRQGKLALLAKARAAKSASKPLESLLESHSRNLEAKSYGRRVESMEHLDVSQLAVLGVETAKPVTGKAYPYDQAGYEYFDDSYTEVPPALLKPGEEYTLRINKEASYAVTIEKNTNGTVSFSKVEG
jgi:hypothetical protein